MHYHFATLFDHHYFSRAISLYQSLDNLKIDFTFYAITITEESAKLLTEYAKKNIIPISINDIEQQFPELIEIKKTRIGVNYIFTLSPYYPLYILQRFTNIPHICSLDADQYFFSSPEPIFNLLNLHSVLITPHRFSTIQIAEGFEVNGKYNVSFQVFKNDIIGNACLGLWRNQCSEWCEDKAIEGKFADQKYLESWESKFPHQIKIIDHIGLGLAPWNIQHYLITQKQNTVYVNSYQLILFHYQGLRILENSIIKSGLNIYGARDTRTIRTKIYTPIVIALMQRGNKQDKIKRGIHSTKLEPAYYQYKNGTLNALTLQYKFQQINLHFQSLLKKIKRV